MTATAAEFLRADADKKVGKKAIEDMAEAMLKRGIEPDMLGRVTRMKMWQGMSKSEDGDPVVTDLYGFHLAPSWEAGPEWPVVAPGKPYTIKGRKGTPRFPAGDVTVVLPDMQIGFYRDLDGSLVPVHDPAAIDIALQVLADVRPSRVVALGDNLDLAEMSKYRLSPAFAQTTQAQIDYATELFANIRATVGPNCTIEWLAGNHEERLTNYAIDNAKASFGLKRGGTPDDWPVLSVPHLCRLDDADVQYRPGYPASDVWITSNLRIIHGNRVKSKGSTAHVYLNEIKSSVIYGHIHRIERAHRTRQDFDGVSEVMAASPGCLARVDGVVPSTNQGLDLDGRPIPRAEDWQQGLAVITVLGDSQWEYEQIRIDTESHSAVWRGNLYTAFDGE